MSQSNPDITVAVTWTAILDDNGDVVTAGGDSTGKPCCGFSFVPNPILLPFTAMNPANSFHVWWDLQAQDQHGNAIPGVVFETDPGHRGIQPDYPGTWGQPSVDPGNPDRFGLQVGNGNASGVPGLYHYTATVKYRGQDYTSDPEIVFETQGE